MLLTFSTVDVSHPSRTVETAVPSGLRVDRFSLWAMLNPQLALLCTGSVSAGTASLLINGLSVGQ